MSRYDPNSIKRLREALKLSQAKFGQKLGMKRQQIHALEQGPHYPTVRTLEKIMDIYGVEESFFFITDPARAHGIDKKEKDAA